MSKYPHISISDDTDKAIKEYEEEKHIKYSWAVEELITLGLIYNKGIDDLDTNNKLLERLLERVNYQTTLLEQIYVDMEFDGKSIANNSKGLRTFKNRYNKNNIIM